MESRTVATAAFALQRGGAGRSGGSEIEPLGLRAGRKGVTCPMGAAEPEAVHGLLHRFDDHG